MGYSGWPSAQILPPENTDFTPHFRKCPYRGVRGFCIRSGRSTEECWHSLYSHTASSVLRRHLWLVRRVSSPGVSARRHGFHLQRGNHGRIAIDLHACARKETAQL